MAKTPRQPRRKPLKKAETVRERATKSQDKLGKVPRRRKMSGMATKPAGKAFRFLGQSLNIHESHEDRSKIYRFLTKHRSFVPSYFRQSFSEILLVTWPTFREVMRLTGAVVLFSVVFALIISGLDWLLEKGFQEVILNESQNIKDFVKDLF